MNSIITESYKEYELKAGKLTIKDPKKKSGKRILDVLCIDLENDHYVFLDKNLNKHSIYPPNITKFQTVAAPKEMP